MADHILVVANGAVRMSGSPQELLARSLRRPPAQGAAQQTALGNAPAAAASPAPAVLDIAQLGLAKIQPAGQLAHHQQIDAGQLFGAQRRGGSQLGIDLHRAQVGEDAQRLAQRQQPLLGAHRSGRVIPLRAADGAQQHRIR